MNLLGTGAVWAARARGLQLDQRSRDPRPTQLRALRHLTQRAASTAFGKQHGLGGVRSHEDFIAACPLHRYQDLKPWFERALAGEQDVTWPGRVRYFGMSSGTTAGNKYLPISMDSVRQQQRGGFDPLAAYLRWTGDTQLLAGKAIMLGGSSQLEAHPSGAWIGDNTGIMARHMPALVQRNYLPSKAVRAVENWDDKIAALVTEAIDADVRLVAGTPSWFPGLFDQLLAEARRRGRRADHVHDVWPNLALLTGGGVNVEPYRKLLRTRLGRHVPYVDVYNATEGGIMGVQDEPSEAPMRLLPDNGLFYEFIPLGELDQVQPTRLPLWEVEAGPVYALAVSTMSGIFSYLIGDCVRFVSLFPHRFVFEGRTAAFLNITGEHVSQGELEQAAQRACNDIGAQLRDFTVAADVGVGPHCAARHCWLVEFDGTTPDVVKYAERIDAHIQAGNGDYAAHRSSEVGLMPPLVQALQPGAFEGWMRARGKLGGQHKVPRVLLDPQQRVQLQAFSL